MHGVGSFFDPRLDNADKFPIAAENKFGHIKTDPDKDRVRLSKLPGLQVYQLVLTSPKPKAGVDFNPAAAKRGDELFNGKAQCGSCHMEPLWTEPGWNLHPAKDIGIDSFQADRAPDNVYKTMNLAGVFIRERGISILWPPSTKAASTTMGVSRRLRDVVNHYNKHFKLGLTNQEINDLIEYL